MLYNITYIALLVIKWHNLNVYRFWYITLEQYPLLTFYNCFKTTNENFQCVFNLLRVRYILIIFLSQLIWNAYFCNYLFLYFIFDMFYPVFIDLINTIYLSMYLFFWKSTSRNENRVFKTSIFKLGYLLIMLFLFDVSFALPAICFSEGCWQCFNMKKVSSQTSIVFIRFLLTIFRSLCISY